MSHGIQVVPRSPTSNARQLLYEDLACDYSLAMRVRLSGEQIDCVRQDLDDGLQRSHRAAGTAGQIEDQRPARARRKCRGLELQTDSAANPAERIFSGMPSMSFEQTARVASGVTSRSAIRCLPWSQSIDLFADIASAALRWLAARRERSPDGDRRSRAGAIPRRSQVPRDRRVRRANRNH